MGMVFTNGKMEWSIKGIFLMELKWENNKVNFDFIKSKKIKTTRKIKIRKEFMLISLNKNIDFFDVLIVLIVLIIF